MIDYISVTKYCDKGTPFLGQCAKKSMHVSGWEVYAFEGCEELKVLWNANSRVLKLQGSFIYFWQGHNFTCSRGDLVEVVEYLQRVLHVGLWDSIVEAFEFGVNFEVEQPAVLYISNTHARAGANLVENLKGKDKGSFKWWDGPAVKLKLYDSRKNILQKQGMKRREIIKAAGWNPEGRYLKFEAHFTKPDMINRGRFLRLEDLVDRSHYESFKQILLEQYKLLAPMKTLKLPTDKKCLTSADILLLVYVMDYINANGCSPADARKEVYSFVNAIPEGTLTKADKDSRKRQLKALFARVQVNPESQWDITSNIVDALAKDWPSQDQEAASE